MLGLSHKAPSGIPVKREFQLVFDLEIKHTSLFLPPPPPTPLYMNVSVLMKIRTFKDKLLCSKTKQDRVV